MKKDAYYFPHFSNARNDSKVIRLRRILGIEGYGIYFMLLEILREQKDFKYPISGLEDLAFEWHTSKEKLLSVINDFQLFEISEDQFFSTNLITYLQPYIEKSERARAAALQRWSNANAYAKALPGYSKSNASKVKESKVKEIIEVKFDFKISLLNLGVEENIVSDWLKVRKNKKATNTETSFNRIKKEIQKSGLSANECITKAVENDWRGFEADWLKKQQLNTEPQTMKLPKPKPFEGYK